MEFDIEGMESKNIAINLENILPSLAKNLYGDDWRIAIRELLQNAHDALAEGEHVSSYVEEPPRIDIIPNTSAGTLTFQDNGVGMTLEQVEKYLATVGAGYKRQELERIANEGARDRTLLDRLIGQYGIGFLSSFIIADQVEVLTASRVENEPGVRAIFTGETRWYSSHESNLSPGSRITLRLKKQSVVDPRTGELVSMQELLNFERLKAEVRRFGDLLPYPIYVKRSPKDQHGEPCNATQGPWEARQPFPRHLVDFVRRRQPDENEPLLVEAFRFEEAEHGVQAHGLLYFPRTGDDPGRSSESVVRVELFSRRMFITSNIASLLPDWATFVGVVAECPQLTPTLDRNDVIRHDSAFVALKQALGNLITQKLQEFADGRAKDYSKVLGEHQQRIYEGMLSDFQDSPDEKESFFRGMIHHIPFTVIDKTTNVVGEAMTLKEYRKEHRRRLRADADDAKDSGKDTIYYLHAPEAIGQYRALVQQRDFPVILAGHGIEANLLLAYGQAYRKEVTVEDVRFSLDMYVEKVDQAPYERMKEFLASLDGGGPDEVTASRFEPSYVPAILTISSAADPERAVLLDRLLNEGGNVLRGKVRKVIEEELRMSRAGQASVAAILNDNNPVVRRLRQHCEQKKPLEGIAADVLHELYHNARAYIDAAAAESDHFFEHRNNLLMTLLQRDHDLREAESKRDRLVTELRSLKKGPVAPEHMEPRACALLLTDLRGSSRMVGFLNTQESAEILQAYADEVRENVEEYGGAVEKFTGDGVFAHFGLEGGPPAIAAKAASDCAFQILGMTNSFFNRDDIAKTLQLAGGITINGSRTVLHSARVMYGEIAGSPALVGPQIVALFRACDRDELFEEEHVILSKSFVRDLSPAESLQPIAEEYELDRALPPMDFYPHPGLARPKSKRNT